MLLSINGQVAAPVTLFGANGEVLKVIKPTAVTLGGVSVDAVITAFKAKVGDHRHTALALLAANFGKPVSRAALLTALYGSDDKTKVGALGMCLEGARKSIKKFNLPYRIIKENATVTLVSMVG